MRQENNKEINIKDSAEMKEYIEKKYCEGKAVGALSVFLFGAISWGIVKGHKIIVNAIAK